MDKGAHGLVLAGLNPAARALGLQLGQAHADACAMAPALVSEPLEPGQAKAALRRLALWAQRYAPLTACDPAEPGLEGLWIETTGADHFFGGEAGLAADLVHRLSQAGAQAQVGVAGTPGAAWALARYAPPGAALAAPGEEAQALAGLPVEALRLSADAVRLLKRFGLRRIGDLYPLPRAALTRRFRGRAGGLVVKRLDQALGRVAEPLTGELKAPVHFAHRVFMEPILNSEGVALWGARLVGELCAKLESQGLGARRLVLTGFRNDGRTTAFGAALGLASREPAHLIRLLRERGWERLDVGFGLDALRLSAPVTEPLRLAQLDSLGRSRAEEVDKALAGLVDRLGAKLGEGAVLRPVAYESWLPERAERLSPYAVETAVPGGRTDAPRPILLLTRPEPIDALAELPDGAPARFTWRRVSRRVARASGPERLSPEWWRPSAEGARPARVRDYYRIEDEAGGRYWVFREGLYDTRPTNTVAPDSPDSENPPDSPDSPDSEIPRGPPAPSWWMHGLFP